MMILLLLFLQKQSLVQGIWKDPTLFDGLGPCFGLVQIALVRVQFLQFLGRGEQPETLLERRSVSDRLARDHALKTYDSKDWTHLHCCFHATIHGLTELSIFNNFSMFKLRTTVTEWLTMAPEPETEDVIERWAIQRQAASTHKKFNT